jgi:hypothetical protein
MEIDIIPEPLLAELGLPTDLERLLTPEVHQLIKSAADLSGGLQR